MYPGEFPRLIIMYLINTVTVILGITLLSLVAAYIGCKIGNHNRTQVNKLISVVGPIFLFVAMIAAVVNPDMKEFRERNGRMQAGVEYEEAGDYYMAYWSYRELQHDIGYGWSDLDEHVERIREPGLYETAKIYEEAHEWIDAIQTYMSIIDYRDAKERMCICMMEYVNEQHSRALLGYE